MKKQKHTAGHTSSQGFSLLEMAVVIGIMSVVLGSMLGPLASGKNMAALSSTNEQLDAIEDAISRYVLVYGYMPCPASATIAEDDINFARATDCSGAAPAGTGDVGSGSDAIRIGMVPTRTLNLADSYATDAWKSRITYVVIKDLVGDSNDFNNFSTSSTDGVIQINDREGDQITDANTDSIVGYTIISHGKDGMGAYTRNAIVSQICASAKTLEYDNCSHTRSTPVLNNQFTDTQINDSTTDANYFFDLVRWKLKELI